MTKEKKEKKKKREERVKREENTCVIDSFWRAQCIPNVKIESEERRGVLNENRRHATERSLQLIPSRNAR